MVDQQQQTTINWLHPADQSVLETTIAYEQVAIDLTADFARNEPDPFVREAFNIGLLEDFDNLYRRPSRQLSPRSGRKRTSTWSGRRPSWPSWRCGPSWTRSHPTRRAWTGA